MLNLILAAALLGQIEVVNENNSGVGSLRAAVSRAERDPFKNEITFSSNVKEIQLWSEIRYESALPLTITGPVEIRALSGNTSVFRFYYCSDITLNDVVMTKGGVVMTKRETDKLNTTWRFNNVTVQDSRGVGVMLSDFSSADFTFLANGLTIVRSESGGAFINKNNGDCYVRMNRCFVGNNGLRANSDGAQYCVNNGNLDARIRNCKFFSNNEDNLELEREGVGNFFASITECDFLDAGEENCELNHVGDGDCIVFCEYITSSGFDINDRDRHDGIEWKINGRGNAIGYFYECSSYDSEYDGLRVVPIGNCNILLELDSCNFSFNNDEGFEFETRTDEWYSGFTQIYMYNCVIRNNLGNGIKAVPGDEFKGILGIIGNPLDYLGNKSGQLDLEGEPERWWLLGIAEELN